TDTGDGLTAIFEAACLKCCLRRAGGGDGALGIAEDAALRPMAVAAGRGGLLAVAHLRQHLLNHAADKIIGDLHGCLSPTNHRVTENTEKTKQVENSSSDRVFEFYFFPLFVFFSVSSATL